MLTSEEEKARKRPLRIPKKKAVKEKSVKQAIREYLENEGAYVAAPVGSVYGKRGVADFLVCFQGHFLAIEVKRPGRRNEARQGATPLQDLHKAKVRAAGGVAMVADCLDPVREAIEVLRGRSN